MTDLNALTSALAIAASRGVAAANTQLREAELRLATAGGEAAKIGQGCLARSLEAFRAIASGEIAQDVGQEVIARELDATAALAQGMAHAGKAELAGFVGAARCVLLEVGVPLLKIVGAIVL